MATLEEKLSKLEEYVKQQKPWKQEFEELKRAYKGLKIERDNLAEIVEQGSKGEEDLLNQMEQLKNRNKLLDAKDKALTRRFKEVEKDLKLYDELRSVFRRMFPKGIPPGFEPGTAPQGRGVSMVDIDERINQRLSEAKEIRVVQIDVDQRIKELVKSSYVQNLEGKIKALPAPAVKAALWMHEKKAAKIGDLYYYMYEKAGRIPGNFYANVVKPLENSWLIMNEAGNVRWILEESLRGTLKDMLRNGDVQDLANYLTSLLL